MIFERVPGASRATLSPERVEVAGWKMKGEKAAKALDAVGESESMDGRSLTGLRREAAAEVIARHERTLMRTARRYSYCLDDAEDAYQRALEILLTKAPPLEGDSLIRWMQTVTKREALGVRRQRTRLVSPAPPRGEGDSQDPLELIASDSPLPEEIAAREERVRRSGEALKALKPQEVRALVLKAEGYSYEEIQCLTGWTYTKVNRCMAEGRKRFLGVFSEIESGDRCDRWSEELSRIADGERGDRDLSEAKVHLRSCGRCRARLRAFREVPKRVLGVGLPIPLLAMVDQLDLVSASLNDRIKAALSPAARALEWAGERLIPFTASGGTRGAGAIALGKLAAVCSMAAAGSAACAVSGVLPEPEKVAAEERTQSAVDTGDLDATTGVKDEAETPGSSSPSEQVAPVQTDPATQTAHQFSFEPPASGSHSSVGPSPAPQPSPKASSPSQQFGFEH